MDKTFNDLMSIVNRTRKIDESEGKVKRVTKPVIPEIEEEEVVEPQEKRVVKKSSSLFEGADAINKLLSTPKKKPATAKKETKKTTTKKEPTKKTTKSTTTKTATKTVDVIPTIFDVELSIIKFSKSSYELQYPSKSFNNDFAKPSLIAYSFSFGFLP